MRELFEEVLTAMKSNRLRIALTGFSIAWGMFILVVLLGSSGGFQRGLYKTFHLDINQQNQCRKDGDGLAGYGQGTPAET